MTPTEVIEKLASLGITISRSTLLRYEQNSLIVKPKRGGLGRGLGRITNYRNEVPYQFYAAWRMQKHFNRNSQNIPELLKAGYGLKGDGADMTTALLEEDLFFEMVLYTSLSILAQLGFCAETPLLIGFSNGDNFLTYAEWPQSTKNIDGAIKVSWEIAPFPLQIPKCEKWNNTLKEWELMDGEKIKKTLTIE